MGVSGGPYIVRDSSLVLELDAADRNSYPGSGTTWRDLTANNNSGSLINGPTYSSANGGSIVFDGIDDSCITNIAFPNTITVITVGKSTNSTWNNFAGLGSARSQNGYIIHNDSGNTTVTFYIIDQSGNYTGLGTLPIPNIQTPNFYAVSTNGSNIHKAYLNGVLQFTNTSTINRTTTPSVIQNSLGRDDNLSRYNACSLYSHLIYSRQLSDSEILQNYNQLKSRFNL